MHSSRMRTGRSLTVCRNLLPGGGVCSGGCLLQGVSALGVSAPRGMSVPGVSAPRGVCSQGVSAPRGVVSQHALRQTPLREQNDRQV